MSYKFARSVTQWPAAWATRYDNYLNRNDIATQAVAKVSLLVVSRHAQIAITV